MMVKNNNHLFKITTFKNVNDHHNIMKIIDLYFYSILIIY
jgi:hypothetical protein